MSWLTQFWKKPSVANATEFEAFLAAESTYLAQKSVFEYCRARAGLAWPKLISEPAFQAALESARWQALAIVLADIMLVSEGFLRPLAGTADARLAESFVAMHGRIIEGSGAPAEARTLWQDEVAEFPARLGRARLAAPKGPADVARVGGSRLYRVMPIHPSMKAHDREVIINSIRFGMVAFHDKLATAVRTPETLVRELTGGGP